jgi:hypothetical protein
MPRDTAGRRGRGGNEVVVIMWRDIPAQINGKAGAERHQVMLPHRFQKAIDRAAMVAGKKTAQDYIGEWRRTEHPLDGALVETVDQIAASIEREFTNERLHVLVANGGWDPASPDAHPEPVTDAAHEPTSDTSDTSDPEGPAS